MQLKHHFLMAMPALNDSNFAASIIYVCQHDAQGALGIIINRLSSLNLRQLLQRLELPWEGAANVPVFAGGPVDTAHGFILHSAVRGAKALQRGPIDDLAIDDLAIDDLAIDDMSIDLGNDLMLSTARDLLAAIGRNEGPAQFLVALGYAGWGPGQLEAEVAQNDWLTCPANTQVLFHTPPVDRVKRAAATLGIDFNLISSQPGHA